MVLLQEGPYRPQLLLLLARCRRQMRLEVRSQTFPTVNGNGDNVTSPLNRLNRQQCRKPVEV